MVSLLSSAGTKIKGPVKLIKRVKIAASFLVCVKSVQRYHFELVYVALKMAVKEFEMSLIHSI